MWLGYQQSLRPSEKGLTLNVDIAATAFLEQQPVTEYMARLAGMRDVRELKSFGLGENARKVSKGMQGIKVCDPEHMPGLESASPAAWKWQLQLCPELCRASMRYVQPRSIPSPPSPFPPSPSRGRRHLSLP